MWRSLLGIGWQKPGACAARSICRDMVFLKGQYRARLWQENGSEGAEVEANMQSESDVKASGSNKNSSASALPGR